MANKIKPVLKWVGGKSNLLPQLRELYPPELGEGKIRDYFEPFLGGGSVFLDIIQNYKVNSYNLSDINAPLTTFYDVLRDAPTELHTAVAHNFKDAYDKIEDKEELYYTTRKAFNMVKKEAQENRFLVLSKQNRERKFLVACYLLILNRTCFNGLYRENQQGEFNTPFGNRKNLLTPSLVQMEGFSKLLRKSTFLYPTKFELVGDDIGRNDFLFLDPPAKGLDDRSYGNEPFSYKHHLELFYMFKAVASRGAKIMLCASEAVDNTSTSSFYHKMYKKYNIHEIEAKVTINQKSNNNSKLLVITNY